MVAVVIPSPEGMTTAERQELYGERHEETER